MTTTLQELDEVLKVLDDPHLLADFLETHATEIRAALELKARVDAGDVGVKRYDPDLEHIGGGYYAADMMSCPNGDFVKYEDYAALEAERDRLREALVKVLSIGDYMPAEDAEVIRQQALTALGGE